MAMSVVYTTVNGQVLSENRGGVVHHFIPDPLGSVVMVRDTAGNTVYTAEYAPYGDVQSETGTNPSEFGYVGTLGYVKDSASSLYVRARYLLTNLGRWLTKDPLWPSEPGFVYAGAGPTRFSDESGLMPSPDNYYGSYCGAKIGIAPVVSQVRGDLGFFDPPTKEGTLPKTCMETWPDATGCLDRACVVHDLCLAPFRDINIPEAAHCHCNAAASAMLCQYTDPVQKFDPLLYIFITVFMGMCGNAKRGNSHGKPWRTDGFNPCVACYRQAFEACFRKGDKDIYKCIKYYAHRFCRHITGCFGLK